MNLIARCPFRVGLGMCLAGALSANANSPTLYRWTQTGYVDIVVGGVWDSSVTPGSPFTTTLIYNLSSALSYPPGTGEARYNDVLVSASMSFGNYTFNFSVPWPGFPPVILVRDDYYSADPTDGYAWYWATPVAQYGMHELFLQGFLLSTDLSLLNSPALDIQEFDISRFNRQTSGQLTGYDSLNNLQVIVFYVTDYSVEPVPEPGAGALLLVAFLVWTWKRQTVMST